MTRGEALAFAAQRLAAAGLDTPDTEARHLLAAALGLPLLQLAADKAAPLTPPQQERLEEWVARRARREPLARIEGYREFWGLRFALNQATLEPRPDSETLVETVLSLCPERRRPLRILDIGTGSGCLLLGLLHEYEKAEGLGTDISESALAQAAENARALSLSPRAAFRRASWADGVEGAFDIIVSNPPYIRSALISDLQPEVRLHDPLLALDGGADGLAAYRALLPQAIQRLKPGGVLAVEIGFDQAEAVGTLLSREGLRNIAVAKDLGGQPRVVSGWA